MPSLNPVVLTETHGATGIVRLNRPDKHNALSQELMAGIVAAVTRYCGDDTVRAIVITGSDKAFSTGVDLNEALEANTPTLAMAYAASFRKVADTVESAPLPVIAAINGWCITGGMELALACDIRYASPGAVFGITSAKIGSVAGGGGTQRLPRAIGSARAKEMLFGCDFIKAEEAERIGLVNRMVADDDALGAALALAEKIAQRGPLGIRWAKSAVNIGMNTDLASALAYEAQLCASAFVTEDRAEGMKAFLEKRAPRFKGR